MAAKPSMETDALTKRPNWRTVDDRELRFCAEAGLPGAYNELKRRFKAGRYDLPE